MRKIKLLPNYFKKIGFILSIATITIMLILIFLKTFHKEIILQLFEVFMLISCLIIALSCEKEEDEMISQLRLKAFFGTFIFGTVYTIVYLLENLFFKIEINHTSGYILILMFISYFGIFNSMKKKELK